MQSLTGRLLGYGAFGWALGAVAVPLYIQVPFLYTRTFGVSLGWVSTILLITRLLDAIADPLIGLWVDRLKLKYGYVPAIVLSAPLMVLGMWGVFFPVGETPETKAISLLVSLVVVHFGFSLATIAYQAWGAELGSNETERSQYVAAREGIGIAGVVLAVSLPATQHAMTLAQAFTVSTLAGLVILVMFSPRPHRQAAHAPGATGGNSGIADQGSVHRAHENPNGHESAAASILAPLKQRDFRRLLMVFLINGIAGALPATLVPFFLRDRLQLPDSAQWTLGVYFLVGAFSTIVWVKVGARIGLMRTWLVGMGLTVVAFIGVSQLEVGNLYGFLTICILTGLALGTDLALPAAILASLIYRVGDNGKREGAYFGLWNWVNKFNLAIAPALALPLLGLLGYQAAGSEVAQNTDALLIVYAVIPCILKLVAMGLLSVQLKQEAR